jgi:hypothetical protein
MFIKSKIVFTALLIIGASSAAFAYEDPENRIGDRYPFLEKVDRTATMPTPGTARAIVRRNVWAIQYGSEDPENKIGDRYPSLEPITASVASANAMASRTPVRQNPKLEQFSHEEPENKIADRYPFLEQLERVSSIKTTASTMRTAKPSAHARKASLN